MGANLDCTPDILLVLAFQHTLYCGTAYFINILLQRQAFNVFEDLIPIFDA